MNNNKLLCKNLTIENNELYFAGLSVKDLAKKYGTPLYLMDEDLIREKINIYKKAINDGFNGKGRVLYASKACSFKHIYEIAKDENIGIDVVSPGEIWTAKSAGFDLSNAFYHSNNKTDEDIKFAIDQKVGYFVIDNEEELYSLDKIVKEKNIKQKVLIRITPGIDCHTLEAISTGKVDSKFGFGIETGLAFDIVEKCLKLTNLELKGFHCHVGSQVFDSTSFIKSAAVMIKFINDINDKFGYLASILDLGGGYGVRYTVDDGEIDIYKSIIEVSEYIKNEVKKYNIEMPEIMFEPGRSIVADAGLSVYTIGSVKSIPGFVNYVSVDGGMGDNIRPALYGANYTIIPVDRLDRDFDKKYNVVGKYCESDDVLKNDMDLPSDIKRRDLLACLTTGAYQYAMASNYNRFGRPEVVMIKDKKDFVVVKRESLQDVVSLDV